ncbi:cytochrome P450 709B2-like [Panicum virgatum]|uniref:cytochrome P450 709B2-like n=1 Tax=Panicum virgatum TaxID=38727 RepID=UPI0019D5279A|nr:cytochrome P450 709B2-like [Panicum virgatum]
MGGGGTTGLVGAALAVVLLPWLWVVLAHLVWPPRAVPRAFARQGVNGLPYRLLVGNNMEVKVMCAAAGGEALDRGSHDIVPRVLPHYRAWAARHGRVFLSWAGPTPTLCVGSYNMARRVLADRVGLFVKPDPGPTIMALLGMSPGIIHG